VSAKDALLARYKLGLTVEAMAKRLDVGVRTLFRWEAQGVPRGPCSMVYRMILDGTLPS